MFIKLVTFIFILSFIGEWYLYTSEAGKFNILFPTKPLVQSKTISSELGEITQTTAYCLNTDSMAIEYQLILSEYDAELLNNGNSDSIMLMIQKTIISEMKDYLHGELVYESESILGGKTAYWFLIKFGSQMALKNCLIWNGSVLISLLHYSKYDKRLDQSSDRFFNSLIFF